MFIHIEQIIKSADNFISKNAKAIYIKFISNNHYFYSLFMSNFVNY